MAQSTAHALLHRASQLVGKDALATRLNVPMHLLDVWLRGHATVPERKLLALIDLLDAVRGLEKN